LVADTDHEKSLTVSGGTRESGLGDDGAARNDGNPGKSCPRSAFDRSRPDRRQVDAPILTALRQGGRIADARRGVLVKAAKRGQDRRVDLPSIGPRTVEGAARAGLAGIAVVSGSTIIAEAGLTGAAADRERLFVIGVRDELAMR